jgi:hypothetical protein
VTTVVLVLGVAAGIAVPQTVHLSLWVTALVLLGLLTLVLAEGAYRVWHESDQGRQAALGQVAVKRAEIAAVHQDLRDEAAKEELGLVRGFHEIAYQLKTRLETAVLIIGQSPTADITDAQRQAYLQQPIDMAEKVLIEWDIILGRIRSQELRGALDRVYETVTTEVRRPLSQGRLPDPAPLRQALKEYREVANRLIGAAL